MEGAREGKESARKPGDPQFYHEENSCLSIFIIILYTPTTCLVFLSVIFLAPPRRFTFFDGCARLSCMLAPSEIYRIHDKRMKSAGVEGTDSWAVLPVDPRIIPA